MNWDMLDYVFAIALLGGVATTAVLTIRKTRNIPYRWAVGVALLCAFLLTWINGAVGIIGSENNDANMMYFFVVAIPVVGAFLVRFKPRGLERTMYVTAASQVVVAELALVHELGVDGPVWPRDVLIMTAFFVALWLLSAWLFRKAARTARFESPAQ